MMASGKIRLQLMVAVAQNQGIGYQGDMPWPRIKTDLKFLAGKTTETRSSDKMNAVLMGRKTWESIPAKNRPLKNRYNIILSSKNNSEFPEAHMVCPSLEVAISNLQTPPLSEQIESVYVLGGSSVYSAVMDNPMCDRIYLTEVMGSYPSDTFFPHIDTSVYHETEDPTLPNGEFEENGVKFRFKLYQRI